MKTVDEFRRTIRMILLVFIPLSYLIAIFGNGQDRSTLMVALLQEYFLLKFVGGLIAGTMSGLIIWDKKWISLFGRRIAQLLSSSKKYLLVFTFVSGFLVYRQGLELFGSYPNIAHRWLPFNIAYLLVILLFFSVFRLRQLFINSN